MTTHDTSARPTHTDKGLRKGAVGFWEGLAVGLDSTAPAYSIAAVLGSLVLVAGVYAPSTLIISFIPMLFIAGAFFYMNRVDPDCGATFSWVTRAMGPTIGWIGGWAVFVTGVLVIGAQTDVAAKYLFKLAGQESLAENTWAVIALTIVLIMALTWVCVIGVGPSARVSQVMILLQVVAVITLAGCAIYYVATGRAQEGAPEFSWSWLDPTNLEPAMITPALLLGVFIYWGWESSVNLTEETRAGHRTAGLAAVVSTVILLVTYVGTAIAILAFAGPEFVGQDKYDDNEQLFGDIADLTMGSWAWIPVMAVITSGLASTQSTIIPATRVSLSMSVAGAFPKKLGQIHPVFKTPARVTWLIGGIACVWYVLAKAFTENFMFDSLSALSIVVALYYTLTAVACILYWRSQLARSVKAFFVVGLGPFLGAVVMAYLVVRSVIEQANPESSEVGTSIAGVGLPAIIAVALMAVGVILMLVWRATGGKEFWERHGLEVVSDDVARAALGPTAPGMDNQPVIVEHDERR